MTDDNAPELATTDAWRIIMMEARRSRGISQSELASKIGATQNAISMIESGATRASHFVPAIATELRIALPVHFSDEQLRRWYEAGEYLRVHSPSQFAQILGLAESMRPSAKID